MKLKRLVSAVLAIGMALTILPTAAFAAGATAEPIDITSDSELQIVGGVPVIANTATTTYTKTENGKNLWKWIPGKNQLWIGDGYSYSGAGEQIITCIMRPGFNFAENVSGPLGRISGGYYTNAVENFGEIAGGTFSNGVSSYNGSKITGGIFKNKPSQAATTDSTVTVLKAEGCTINRIINGGTAYVVGAQTITVSTPVDERFIDWKSDDITITDDMKGKATIDGMECETLTFTMPTDKNVTIIADRKATPIVIKDGVPAYKDEPYAGHEVFDKWTYTSNTLRIFNGFVADLKNEKVSWAVINKEGGTLKNATIANSISNYGTVENVTCIGDFINNGEIISGVFSRYAKFGKQNPAVRWVTVNGGTVNGMTTAGVVGEQEVTITAPDGFKCWSVAGDTDFTLTEEQKHTNPLTLKLNGENKGTIILTAQSEEGYYPLNLTDGKAYSVTADGAKDKEITAARAGDTVILEADATLIPDGMVFDRWEITGNTELTGGFDASAEKTQFIMPNTGVTIRAMYRMADVEEPDVLGTVAVVATAGVGAAVLGWTGYQLGTELYLKTALPAGTAIPTNRAELALLVWNHAGKPAPAAVLPADATDTQKAVAWAVENDLLKAAKDNGETYVDTDSVSRVEVIRVWNKAQEK